MLKDHTSSKKAGAYLGLFIVGAVLALYLASYFWLWKIGLSPYRATPWTIIDYWRHYSGDPASRRWMTICLVAGYVPAIVAITALLMPIRRALHGDARFARVAEIRTAGLLGDWGLILGKMGSKYIMLPGQQGAICAAPPRSGKGASIVQPNLLAWPDSVVVLDIRQEAFRLTSGFRGQVGEVYLFDPVAEDGRTMQWNPLSYVRDDNPVLRIDDIQKIGGMLFPDPERGDSFWMASSRSLFLGLALFVFETPGLPRTLGEVVRQIMNASEDSAGAHWSKIIVERDQSDQPLSSVCVSALTDFINTSSNTQSSIRKTVTSRLELWLSPMVDAATSANSFDLRDLRKKRISVYVGVRPADLDRLQLILNLFFQQIIDLNTLEMPEDNPELARQLLLVMDEFTAIGRMAIFAKAVSFLGGYNVRPVIIIQGMSQLRAVYGTETAETIQTCCAAMVVFAPKDQRQATETSEMLGDTTVKAKSKSTKALQMQSGASVTASEHARRLLLPQEVKEIGQNAQLIFLENVKPILCKKIWYWKDPIFKKRLLPPMAIPQITVAEHPVTPLQGENHHVQRSRPVNQERVR